MKKYLSLLLLIVLCGLNATAQNVIKMTTEQAVGNTFKMLVTTVDGKEPQLTGAKLKSTWKNTALLTYEVVAAEMSIDTRVKGLTCSKMALTALDVTQATDLVVLNCHNNKLHELNLTQNKALSKLTCSNNQLTELQLSNCTALTVLYCQNNLLQNLDLSANSKLQTLELDGNGLKGKSVDQLVALLPDRSKEKKAGKLYCVKSANRNETNVFTKAQVAGAKAKNWVTYDAETKSRYEGTEEVQKPENVIKMTTSQAVGKQVYLAIVGSGTITIEGVKEPISLSESVANQKTYTLQSPEITIKGDVTALGCHNNQLSHLDVSQSAMLTELNCGYNRLTNLDVSKNKALKMLNCSYNRLPSIDISHNEMLETFDCKKSKWTTLDVSHNPRLTQLVCASNKLTTLDLTQNRALTKLECNNNKLTQLNLSNNPALEKIACYNNKLASIDVHNCQDLTVLECDNNRLGNLDVTGNVMLDSLLCSGNLLTNLNLASSRHLTYLDCSGNKLSALVAPAKSEMSVLHCYMNLLNEQAMQALVASMPDLNGKFSGKFYVVDPTDAAEGNVCNTNQVATMQGKNWKVFDSMGSDYTGTEPTLAENMIAMTTGKNIGDKIALTVTGKGTVTIEGVAEPLVLNFPNVYTLTSQEIKIVGKVKTLTCADNLLTAIDVTQAPTLTFLDCSRNQLTSLNVDNNVALKRLVCMENKLTSLNLSQNSELFRLDCALNSISGVEMEKLVNSLPDRNSPKTAGTLLVKSITHEAEANECTTSQVQIAKGKNWNVMALNGDDAEPYTGTEHTAITTATQDSQAVVAVSCYDPSGRQLGTLTRGINIVKMSDGTTRKVIVQ